MNANPPRLYAVDYLRGLNACFIMAYHYVAWAIGMNFEDYGSAWLRFSALRVPLFYALSGLTLCHVYYGRMAPSWSNVALFFKNRFLRLYPLLWVTLLAAVYFYYYLVDGKVVDWEQAALNFTGLFGFVAWDQHLSAGVWSVGNVLVFSTVFPLLVLFARKCKPLFTLSGAAILGIFLYFTFTNDPGSPQWERNYTNPLNQMLLFFGGFCIPLAVRKIRMGGGKMPYNHNIIALMVIVLAIACFFLFPLGGKSAQTGMNRVVFTGCCFLICAGAYALRFKAPGAVHAPLAALGKASYSIFLLHAVVYWAVVNGSLPPVTRIVTAGVVSIALSYLSRRYVEEFFISMGRKRRVKSEERRVKKEACALAN
jgi:peptidoglycan/LPS O-acetylase OafA/YrhL